MAEKPARRGRKPRGAAPAIRLVVYVLPATKQALEREAATQAVSPGAVLDGWAAAQCAWCGGRGSCARCGT